MIDLTLILIFGIYASLILLLSYGFKKIKNYNPQLSDSEIKFSVIIPCRNEAENLPRLLNSLELVDYPIEHFEIWFIDDASVDKSREIIKNFTKASQLNIKLIDNLRISNSPKKDAITTAISQTNFEWIITTDADCVVPKKWLSIFNSFILESKVDFIASAVAYHENSSFFKNFQALDFMSLQGVTIGAFGIDKAFMCNGANLAYKRSIFYEINGFDGNANMVSGDDVFLLQKVIQKKNFKIKYLKSREHTVLTHPVTSLKDLFYQRIRWASKTKAYQDYFSKLLALSVFLVNLSLVVSIPFLVFKILKIETVIVIWTGKLIIDAFLIYQTTILVQQKHLFKYYVLSSIIYPFFTVTCALASFFKTFEWKMRTFNN